MSHAQMGAVTTGILVLSLGAWVVGVSANSALWAGLNGEKEVSSEGEKGVGDPNGRGRRLCGST